MESNLTYNITAKTSLYAVIGNPVAHSMSPVLHNAAFKATGVDAAYLAFRITDVKKCMEAVRTLPISGLSVTIPHKIEVMEHLDEIDGLSLKIGAVNTVVNKNGKLLGSNTDCSGAVRSLHGAPGIQGKTILVVGAGGAARAVCFGIVENGGNVVITNRTASKGESLATDVGGDFVPFSDLKPDYDVIINTTSVGMSPHENDMPPVAAAFRKDTVVMDAVYSPIETLLLRTARKRGLTPVNGLSMFVNQAADQFELWTGKQAPVHIMKEAVLEAFNRALN